MAKIRPIRLGKLDYWVVEFGREMIGYRNFQLFKSIDAARLFCAIDLNLSWREVAND
jgi:hypothetical protein